MVETDPNKILSKFGITGTVAAIIMIIFGILVIVFPSLIAWIIGLYLIIVGIINLMGHMPTAQAQYSSRAQPQPAPRARRVR